MPKQALLGRRAATSLMAPTGQSDAFHSPLPSLLSERLVREGLNVDVKTPSAIQQVDLHSDLAKLLQAFIGTRNLGFCSTRCKERKTASAKAA